MATKSIPADAQRIAEAISFEKTVLGLAMKYQEATKELIAKLCIDDFYLTTHQEIYRAILEEFGRQHPVDYLTVYDRLGWKEQFGDFVTYFDQYTCLGPTPISYHCERIIEAAERRKVQAMLQESMNALGTYRDDLVERVQSMSTDMIKLLAKRSKAVHISVCLEELMKSLNDGTPGYFCRTGFPSLDNWIGGLFPHRMMVIGGRTSMGKTAFAQTLCLTALKAGVPSAYFCIEGTMAEFNQRLVAIESGVSIKDADAKNLDFDQRERFEKAASRLKELPLYLFEEEQQWERIRANIQLTKIDHPDLKLVFLDHLHLVQYPKIRNRWEAIDFVLSDLRMLIKKLDLCVVILQQINRDGKRKDQRPTMMELRDTGSVEEQADVILLLYRPAYYDKTKDRLECQIAIAKQRNGPTGQIKLNFYGHSLKFTE